MVLLPYYIYGENHLVFFPIWRKKSQMREKNGLFFTTIILRDVNYNEILLKTGFWR